MFFKKKKKNSLLFDIFAAASGPVRLFTPYKRRRKAHSEHANESITASSNLTSTMTITTSPLTTTHNSSSSNLNNNSNIANNNQQATTQQIHIQSAPLSNNINNLSNNNNPISVNNNGIKKKRFSLNIVNVKPSGTESSDDIETENISFAPAVTPSVKEESPWQTVTEAIQEIPSEYAIDQSCENYSNNF